MSNDYEEIHCDDENKTKAYVNHIPLENHYENTVGWQQPRRNKNVSVDTTISQQFNDNFTAKKLPQLETSSASGKFW